MSILVALADLNCYQCNSTLDHNCGEKFDHELKDNPVQPKKCTIYLAQYCVKVTGLWGGNYILSAISLSWCFQDFATSMVHAVEIDYIVDQYCLLFFFSI